MQHEGGDAARAPEIRSNPGPPRRSFPALRCPTAVWLEEEQPLRSSSSSSSSRRSGGLVHLKLRDDREVCGGVRTRWRMVMMKRGREEGEERRRGGGEEEEED